MTVEINKKQIEVSEIEPLTLAALLENRGLGAPGQAVAVDNHVVVRSAWPETPLRDGMKITVITAVCGG
ncbi:MAG: sulfur carrier protein ThiS [Bacteroides sp.]|nr:sulfur carrier protein ThiS [Bacteroides sp.]